jgi:hypothetical protein
LYPWGCDMPASKILSDYFKSTYPRQSGNFQLISV